MSPPFLAGRRPKVAKGFSNVGCRDFEEEKRPPCFLAFPPKPSGGDLLGFVFGGEKKSPPFFVYHRSKVTEVDWDSACCDFEGKMPS